jgi:hypothetical protein
MVFSDRRYSRAVQGRPLRNLRPDGLRHGEGSNLVTIIASAGFLDSDNMSG